jgi:thiosulfate reductase cytochrome b subunit
MERIFILPIWIRIWHWLNAILILVLIVTGFSLHFADPSLLLVGFETSAKFHNIAGLALVGLYIFFVIANIFSGNWWQYVPKPGQFLEKCWVQLKFYAWGIFRGQPHPYPPTREANFNALQQITYWFIMYFFMPILMVTGLIFLWPEFAPKEMFGVDGLLPIAVLHYLVGAVIIAFMILHIYLGSTGLRAGTLYKMMITGWHEH